MKTVRGLGFEHIMIDIRITHVGLSRIDCILFQLHKPSDVSSTVINVVIKEHRKTSLTSCIIKLNLRYKNPNLIYNCLKT